jgi:hypothetical protein
MKPNNSYIINENIRDKVQSNNSKISKTLSIKTVPI